MTFIESYLVGTGIGTYLFLFAVLLFWMLKEIKNGK